MSILNKKSVTDLDVKGKRVLVRCDFNVPMKDGKITNDARIVAAIPTIQYLVDHGACVILCSHLGRPKGAPDPQFSLQPVADDLSKKLGLKVEMATDVVGPDAQAKSAALKEGQVLLLENVRFEPGETKNDPELAKQFANLAGLYVNDAFGTAHRAHASTAGVDEYLPSAAGFLMQKEIDYIGGALEDPKHPFVAILGGAKVSDKIGVIDNLLDKVDTIIIGGGMAYTFAKAAGGSIGASLCEDDKLDVAKAAMEKAEKKGVKFLLPQDSIIADAFSAGAAVATVPTIEIPNGWLGVDIGPESIKEFDAAIKDAKTIIWNGPMGVFEMAPFAKGTLAIAGAVADASEKNGAISIVGGGDSVAAVTQLGYANKMSHISTGGGATLEFLEGKEMPGIASLDDKGDDGSKKKAK